ncbi:MAG: flagellar biosynthesis protein FlhA [Thermodesulfobacteriota bacterium]
MTGIIKKMGPLRKGTELALPLGVVGILVVMILPVPPVLLDLFLSLNITISIIILLVAVYTARALEFSTLPTILLVTTLFRLALNVASTRLILLHGSEGPGAAGEVIRSFGGFVVGGNYAVGVVVFAILVIINFVVITKGAGRIAEVAARFTLDAMPGKQMAIDADLAAGLIGEEEARAGREAISREADFYGAMDGASKFVRGDAVAAILITMINITGGLAIGVLQQGLTVGQAARAYTLLTVGDGLVAQIPALVISTAAGLVVSNVGSRRGLASSLGAQFAVNPKPLLIASGILFFFAVMPGLPHMAFFILAAVTAGAGFFIMTGGERTEDGPGRPDASSLQAPAAQVAADDIPLVETLALEVGYRLIPMVNANAGAGEGDGGRGELLERIRAIRLQFAEEMGIVVPPVHIRDNLVLKPRGYSLLIRGVEVAGGELIAGHSIAVDPGSARPGLEGVETTDPAFGLPSLWIPDSETSTARSMGYTVVSHSAVIATHVTEIIKRHCHELLGRQETQDLLDKVSKVYPRVVEELVPSLLTLGAVQKVLSNLLSEGVSIRDIQTILEVLADHAPTTRDTDLLTEQVRTSLARRISRSFEHGGSVIHAVALNQEAEDAIAGSVHETPEGCLFTIEPAAAERILAGIGDTIDEASSRGLDPVILASSRTRRFVRRLTERTLPSVPVLAHSEIAENVRVETLKVVGL